MKINVLDRNSKQSKSIDVSDNIFAKPLNHPLVHQVITAYMAKSRAGTKAQKNRSTARGGGRKPFSQKGSGRARAGTIRSPIWRGGGVTFAARTRDYSQKVNKKMYCGAMCVVLSELLREGRLKIVDNIHLDTPKTKEALTLIADLKVRDVLFVTESPDEHLYLASRNLYHVGLLDISNINPVSLLIYKNVVFTKAALEKVEALYG